MDYSGTEWSSGCESGWTSYFEESSHSPNQWQSGNSNTYGLENHKMGNNQKGVAEEEEEDLSMVSDASSGPPSQFQEYYQDSFDLIPSGYHCPAADVLHKKNDIRKNKKKKNGSDQQRAKHQQQQQGHLDDTATSPALNHSKMRYAGTSLHQASVDQLAIDFPQRFPTTDQYQGNSALGNQFGIWQSTHPKISDQAERSQMRGKRWK